jgi:hypothetical protein
MKSSGFTQTLAQYLGVFINKNAHENNSADSFELGL